MTQDDKTDGEEIQHVYDEVVVTFSLIPAERDSKGALFGKPAYAMISRLMDKLAQLEDAAGVRVVDLTVKQCDYCPTARETNIPF